MYVAAGAAITLACAAYPFCGGFWTLLAARFLHGMFFAVNTTVSLVLVAAVLPQEKMGQGIGLFGIGPIIAISFAPGFGLKISSLYGQEWSFFLASMMALAAAACMLFIKADTQDKVAAGEKPARQSGNISKKTFRIKNVIAVEVIAFSVFSGLFSFANSIEYTFMALYGESKGIHDVWFYFTASAVFILISRLFAGKLYDKKGLAAVLYPSYLIAAAGMLLLGTADTILLFVLAAALKALGQGAGQPALQSHCMMSVAKNRRGLASSTYYLGPDIMQGIGPAAGGAVIEHFGYSSVYYLCGLLLIIGLLVSILHRKFFPPENKGKKRSDKFCQRHGQPDTIDPDQCGKGQQ